MTDAELEVIIEIVRERLSENDYNDFGFVIDEWRYNWWAAQPPASPEEIAYRQDRATYLQAKQRARDGDPGPLRKILIDLTGDPKIADFIAQPPWPKHKRKNYTHSMPFIQLGREVQGDKIQHVREILKVETGKKRVPQGLVAEVAARILKLSPDQIREIIKRGSPDQRS